MANTTILKIDVTKLKKEWFFKGQRGIYVDLALYENDQPDEYGNTHSIKQNPPKEKREAGEKGHYVGNGKALEKRQQQRPAQQKPREEAPWEGKEEEDDQVPF